MKAFFRLTRIQSKLIILLILAMLSFAATFIYVLNASIGTLKQEKSKEILAAGSIMMTQIEQRLINHTDRLASIGKRQVIIDTLHGLHNDPDVAQDAIENHSDFSVLNQRLQREIRIIEQAIAGIQIFQNIILTDRQGHIVAAAEHRLGKSAKLNDWWLPTVENSRLITESEDGSGISLSVRINDAQGSFIGIIQAILPTHWLTRDLAATFQLRPSSEVRLTNAKGRLIYSSRPYRYLEDAESETYFQLFLNGDSQMLVEEGGKKKLYVLSDNFHTAQLNDLQWLLFIADDLDLILKDIYRLMRQMLYVFLIFSIGFAILAIVVNRTILRPILELRKKVAEVADGDFDQKLELRNKDEIGDLAAAFNRMAERLKTTYKKLEYEANTDDLTGVANRRHFFKLAERQWNNYQRYKRPLSMLMLDIDHFKRINDKYGHETGDTVLREAAQLIQRNCRSTDIFGRIGGEEFALLMVETDRDASRQFAVRVCKQLADTELMVIQDKKINITISIGVAHAKPQEDSLDAFISRADDALYLAKKRGRNQVREFIEA